MADDHEHFEALAVGHVLGGLDAVDAVAFRSHLQGCRECRSRVAELRGIAANLAEVEQNERSRRPLRTESPPRVEREEHPRASWSSQPRRVGPRHVTVAALLVLVLAAATAFWNFHLRTVVATAAVVAEQREQTLLGLARGVPVHADVAPGVQGLVVVGDARFAFVLTGFEGPEEGERLVARISGGALERPQVVRVANRVEDEPGAFSASAPTAGAQRLTVEREAADGTSTLLEAEIGEPEAIGATSR